MCVCLKYSIYASMYFYLQTDETSINYTASRYRIISDIRYANAWRHQVLQCNTSEAQY